MTFARSAALIASLFGRRPGALPTLHAATLGSLLALGCAGAAHAAVVTSPAANIAVPVTTSGIYINVVSGAAGTATAATGWDINPWGSGSLFIWTPTTAGSGVVSTGTAPSSLPPGFVVGPADTFVNSGSGASAASGWTLNATNYFGFEFIGDDTFLHYGYGTMIVGSAFNAAGRTVGGLWYESLANTAITIPSAAVVPEASSTAMLLAGAAALSAVALRRRRQAGA